MPVNNTKAIISILAVCYTLFFLYRWTSSSVEVIPYSSFVKDKDLLASYPAPEVTEDVINQQTLGFKLNPNNYVHHMHSLLRLEEFTQNEILSRL